MTDGLVLERIEVGDDTVFAKWAMDPLTLEPLYNADGTRQRGLLSIVDVGKDGRPKEDTREVMEIHDSGPGWVLVNRRGATNA